MLRYLPLRWYVDYVDIFHAGDIGVPCLGRENVRSFASFCTNNKFAVLKLEQTAANKKFELVPYCPGLPSPNETAIELTCIIIELDVINNP